MTISDSFDDEDEEIRKDGGNRKRRKGYRRDSYIVSLIS